MVFLYPHIQIYTFHVKRAILDNMSNVTLSTGYPQVIHRLSTGYPQVITTKKGSNEPYC
jgi:hypothetical protein